jgi:hypothetical protein
MTVEGKTLTGMILTGFYVCGDHYAASVVREDKSKKWRVRYYRRVQAHLFELEKEESLDMPDAENDKELELRARLRVADVLEELEAGREAAM